MRHVVRALAPIVLGILGSLPAAAEPVTGERATITASDGTKLAASYYSAGQPGPGILLFHQCNQNRNSWNALAEALAGKGFHVLTYDYRGYGQSEGTPFDKLDITERNRISAEKWPGDADAAFAYLKAQPGTGAVFGAGGASCGVNQSIQLSSRHTEVKSLVLLSGNTNRAGRQHLKAAKALPLFIAAADDDGGVVAAMAWIEATSGNPSNKFVRYSTGGHGTDMFKPHPDLPGDIVAWFEATLAGRGKVSPAAAPLRNDPTLRLLVLMDEPGGPPRVAEALAAERTKNPKSALLEPGFVNQLGYEAIAAGSPSAAVAILQINVDTRPTSSNAWDSLGDALLADGQKDKALAAARKSLSLVDADTAETAEQRTLIRQSAQGKVDQLTKAGASK